MNVNAPIEIAIRIRDKSRETIPEAYRKSNPETQYPWAFVQLSKAERKGKTVAEIEEARKIKWGRMTDTPIDKVADATQDKGEGRV
jgi:hypothetical protein